MNHKCPVCRKTVKVPPDTRSGRTKYFPFCSERCKLIDLGTWLDAEYKITSKLTDNQSETVGDNR
ncbi:MAG: DNA gyrase inhibitor YacG [Planctomycetota bacterium]